MLSPAQSSVAAAKFPPLLRSVDSDPRTISCHAAPPPNVSCDSSTSLPARAARRLGPPVGVAAVDWHQPVLMPYSAVAQVELFAHEKLIQPRFSLHA
jgi:hypothetical protein